MVKCLHQVHSLFGVDRAIDGGVSQALLLKVQGYNFQHAGPLRDNDTEKEDNMTTTPKMEYTNSQAEFSCPVNLKIS